MRCDSKHEVFLQWNTHYRYPSLQCSPLFQTQLRHYSHYFLKQFWKSFMCLGCLVLNWFKIFVFSWSLWFWWARSLMLQITVNNMNWTQYNIFVNLIEFTTFFKSYFIKTLRKENFQNYLRKCKNDGLSMSEARRSILKGSNVFFANDM